jgi:phosphoserine phosphatase
MYIQLDYFMRKLAVQAENDPALQAKQPWKSAFEKDFDWLGNAVAKHYRGDDEYLHILLGGILSLAKGFSVEQVEREAEQFIMNESHPILDLAYRDCIYQPMLELLQYLEANGFTNYIVSGGGRDFMRGFSEKLYGIPRERVIGSTVAYEYAESEQGGEIVQKAEMDVVDDGAGKPIQIWNVIGRRPILAAGNSNGDLPMMAFSGGDALPALRLLILHDDAAREFDYTAGAEEVIRVTENKNWTSISIQNDWKKVFPL